MHDKRATAQLLQATCARQAGGGPNAMQYSEAVESYEQVGSAVESRVLLTHYSFQEHGCYGLLLVLVVSNFPSGPEAIYNYIIYKPGNVTQEYGKLVETNLDPLDSPPQLRFGYPVWPARGDCWVNGTACSSSVAQWKRLAEPYLEN